MCGLCETHISGGSIAEKTAAKNKLVLVAIHGMSSPYSFKVKFRGDMGELSKNNHLEGAIAVST